MAQGQAGGTPPSDAASHQGDATPAPVFRPPRQPFLEVLGSLTQRRTVVAGGRGRHHLLRRLGGRPLRHAGGEAALSARRRAGGGRDRLSLRREELHRRRRHQPLSHLCELLRREPDRRAARRLHGLLRQGARAHQPHHRGLALSAGGLLRAAPAGVVRADRLRQDGAALPRLLLLPRGADSRQHARGAARADRVRPHHGRQTAAGGGHHLPRRSTRHPRFHAGT